MEIKTKDDILKIIKTIQCHPDTNYFDVYNPVDKYWDIYFQITGFIGDNYFGISAIKSYDDCELNFEILEHVTDDIEQIKKIIGYEKI